MLDPASIWRRRSSTISPRSLRSGKGVRFVGRRVQIPVSGVKGESRVEGPAGLQDALATGSRPTVNGETPYGARAPNQTRCLYAHEGTVPAQHPTGAVRESSAWYHYVYAGAPARPVLRAAHSRRPGRHRSRRCLGRHRSRRSRGARRCSGPLGRNALTDRRGRAQHVIPASHQHGLRLALCAPYPA